MAPTRRNNQFSISTRDHCYFPRDYFPVFSRCLPSSRDKSQWEEAAFREESVREDEEYALHAIFPDARTWYEAPSSCDLHVVFSLFLLLKILERRISTKSATQNLWHHRHALGGSAARPVGRAFETLFKSEFTLFLEALFRPGGTDLAVAGVLLVYCARVNHATQWRRGKGRKRARHGSDRDSLSFTSRSERT